MCVEHLKTVSIIRCETSSFLFDFQKEPEIYNAVEAGKLFAKTCRVAAHYSWSLVSENTKRVWVIEPLLRKFTFL